MRPISCADPRTLRDFGNDAFRAQTNLFDHNRRASGAKPRLSLEQEREWLNWSATDRIAKHGVVRWPRIDLAHVIEQRYGVKLAERSVRALLRRRWVPADIGSTSMSRAGWRPPKAHKKTFPIWSCLRPRPCARQL